MVPFTLLMESIAAVIARFGCLYSYSLVKRSQAQYQGVLVASFRLWQPYEVCFLLASGFGGHARVPSCLGKLGCADAQRVVSNLV